MSNPKQRINAKRVLTSNGLHLSASAINVLLVARAEVTAGPEISSTRRDGYRHALGAILKVAGYGATVRVADRENLDFGALPELDQWLRALPCTNRSMTAVKSRARAAIRAAGMPLPDGRGRHLLSTEWIAARKILKPKNLWGGMSNFPHWASAVGIAPPDITGGALEAYRVERYAGLQEKGARQCYLSVVDAVRAALVELGIDAPDDLPGREYGEYRYAYSRSQFNDEFHKDVDAAAACIANAWMPWRSPQPGAVAKIAKRLLRLASAVCRQQKRLPASLMLVRDLCELSAANAALAFLIDRNARYRPGTHHSAAYQAACLIFELTEVYVDVDTTDRERLQDLRCEHAPPFSTEISVDKQQVIRHFFQSENAAALRQLPHKIHAECIQAGSSSSEDNARRLTTAISLELGLKFALWPCMLAACVVRYAGSPAVVGAPVEIIIDPTSGQTHIHVKMCTRSGERRHEVRGSTLAMLSDYLRRTKRTASAKSESEFLLPGRSGGRRCAASISRNIAALISEKFDTRVTAGHLPHITAVVILSAPKGSRALARNQLGRAFSEHDRLLDTIERWLEVEASDRDLRDVVPPGSEEIS